jgi:hypothetical protein
MVKWLCGKTGIGEISANILFVNLIFKTQVCSLIFILVREEAFVSSVT